MIIHRAFIREVLQTFSVVTAILLSIFLVTRLVDFLSEVADGDVPMNSVLVLLLLKMTVYIDVIFPLVLYISMLLVVSRWIRDNELVVINACGIGLDQFVRPVTILFTVIGTLVATFSLYLSPLSAEFYQSTKFKNRAKSDITGIIPGVFTETKNELSTYFIESYEPETGFFHDVFVYRKSHSEDNILVANTAYKKTDNKTNGDFLLLKNGSEYRNQAGSEFYTTTKFETYAILLKQRSDQRLVLPISAQSTRSLIMSDDPFATGELSWRISKIVMLPVLMIFALSFSSIGYRKNRFPGMITALLVYFVYFNILGLIIALISKGSTVSIFSLWLVHLFFLAVSLYLFKRRKENLGLVPGFS